MGIIINPDWKLPIKWSSKYKHFLVSVFLFCFFLFFPGEENVQLLHCCSLCGLDEAWWALYQHECDSPFPLNISVSPFSGLVKVCSVIL